MIKTLSEFQGQYLDRAIRICKISAFETLDRQARIEIFMKELNLSNTKAYYLLGALEAINHDAKDIVQVIVLQKDPFQSYSQDQLKDPANLIFNIKTLPRRPKNPNIQDELIKILALKPKDFKSSCEDLESYSQIRLLEDRDNIGVYTFPEDLSKSWIPVRAWVIFSEYTSRLFTVDYAFEFSNQVFVHSHNYEVDFMHLHGEDADRIKKFMAAKEFTILLNPNKKSESVVFGL